MAGFPDIPEGAVYSDGFSLHSLMGHVDADVHTAIAELFDDAAAAGVEVSELLIGEVTNAESVLGTITLNLKGHIDEALAWIRRGHAGHLESIFDKLAREEIDQRGAQELIRDLYKTSYVRAEGVARTEAAWAMEEAAMTAFLDAGVSALMWDFGGGPCSTGICYDLNGKVVQSSAFDLGGPGFGAFPDPAGDFQGTIMQPPAHPNCTCALLPADLDEVTETPGEGMTADEERSLFDLFEDLNTRAETTGEIDSNSINTVYEGVVLDENGNPLSKVVVKPLDEMFDDPDIGAPRINIPDAPDEGSAREVASYLLDELMGHYAGVPETIEADVAGHGRAVVQRFVDNDGEIGMWGAGLDYAGDTDAHRIAVFDWLTGNLDRHGGNGLVRSDDGRIVPIDHGLTFPEFPAGAHGNTMAMNYNQISGGAQLTDYDREVLQGLLDNWHNDSQGGAAVVLETAGLSEDAVILAEQRLRLMLEQGRIPSADDWGDLM